MEIVKSFKDKVLSTWNKQKSKKNLKNTQKSKKKLFYFKFKFNSNIIFYLKNCSCKSNLKYLIQLDNKFDSSFRVIRTLLIRYSTSTKTIRRRTISFQEKLQKKWITTIIQKLWNINIFLTLSSLNLTHMQTKNPSYTSFYTFSTSTQKVHLTKVKTILTPLQTLRDKAC